MNGRRLRRAALAAMAASAGFVAWCGAAAVHADDSAYVLSDVQCDANHNGVLDLTLVNERAEQEAVFVVEAARTVGPASVAVAAASVSAITFTDLEDGSLVVPVAVDGVTSQIAVRVACDAPEVAVMAAAPIRSASAGQLPSTGTSSTGGLVIGSALVAAGMAASLVARRRCS